VPYANAPCPKLCVRGSIRRDSKASLKSRLLKRKANRNLISPIHFVHAEPLPNERPANPTLKATVQEDRNQQKKKSKRLITDFHGGEPRRCRQPICFFIASSPNGRIGSLERNRCSKGKKNPQAKGPFPVNTNQNAVQSMPPCFKKQMKPSLMQRPEVEKCVRKENVVRSRQPPC